MFHCGSCRREFSSSHGKSNHEFYCKKSKNISSKEYMCDRFQCRRSFLSDYGLKTHIRKVHADLEQDIFVGLCLPEVVADDEYGPPPVADDEFNNDALVAQSLQPIDRYYQYIVGSKDSLNNKYFNHQFKVYEGTFGRDAFYAEDSQSFIKAVKYTCPIDTVKESISCQYVALADELSIGREGMDKLIGVTIEALQNSNVPESLIARTCPGSFKAAKNAALHDIDNFAFLKHIMEWPEAFEMHRWDKKHGVPPEKIEMIGRDALFAAAELYVNPEVMFGWEKHINFKPYLLETPSKERYYKDIFSSEWAHMTMDMLLSNGHKDPYLMPILLYDDKVAINNTTTAEAVFGTLGNFSPELMRKLFAKMHLGFIVGTESVNETLLLEHLTKTLKKTKTVGLQMIKDLFRDTKRVFWKLTLGSLQNAFANGVYMQILGKAILLNSSLTELIGDFRPWS